MADVEKHLHQPIDSGEKKEISTNILPTSSDSGASSDEDVTAARQRILREKELVNSEPPTLPLLTLFRKKQHHNLEQIATQPSVYDDPETAKYFQPTEKYENLHRFDPSFRWTWGEELPLINKLDWKITLWACVAFFALDLDRGNLSQANTDNFLEDMGLDTNDFNLGNTVFRVAFLAAELPSQLVSKKLGPDRWIPTIMCLWSIVAAAQFWLKGRASFLACRALLGMLQGGFIPDIILYLSYFFKGSELPFRLALFWTTLRIVDVIAPILAFGILRLRGVHGYEGWRWLFLIEGLFTLAVGIWSWFMMAPSPTQTKSWYRPKGWFTEKEEKIMVNRILRDDPSKGDMHNRQAVDLKLLWKSITDFDLWPIYLIGLCFQIPAGPPDQYQTLTLRGLGFDTFDSNLLSIPNQAIGAVTMLVFAYFSELWSQRAFFGIFAELWLFPNVIALAVLPASTSSWVRYSVLTVLLSWPSHMQCKSVGVVEIRMLFEPGLCLPPYTNRRGNRQLAIICGMNIVVYSLTKRYYIWRNKSRDKIWNAMTDEQKLQYHETTTDEGNKRLDFRFVA